MFASVPYFYVIWILGLAVLLPIVSMLFGDDDGESERHVERVGLVSDDNDSTKHDSLTDSTSDVLATLRDRYFRGDLSDEQFDQKLDRLLMTESPEAATEWRTNQHKHDRNRDRGPEGLREWEGESR